MNTAIFDLHESVALITGGGSGIGKATALTLSAFGAIVVVTELPGRGHLAKRVVDEIISKGGKAMDVELDVTATLTIPHIIHLIVERYGRLDILINNAGTQLIKPAVSIAEEEFDYVMDVNLKGAFFCAQAAATVMIEQNRGCIVNVCSQHGVVGNTLRTPYCASKGGLVNLTRALAVEWAEYGIRVNAISPTFVINDDNESALESAEMLEEIERGVLLKRAATALEVAGGICYLVSPIAAMVTGHNLMVDGGWTAK